MRGDAKNSVLKMLRSASNLAPRSGYTFLVLSTGGVRVDVEMSGFRTEGERFPRIIWVKLWSCPKAILLYYSVRQRGLKDSLPKPGRLYRQGCPIGDLKLGKEFAEVKLHSTN